MTALPRPGLVELDANIRILANIREKMSLVWPRVQVEEVALFVYVRQRHNVGPPPRVAGSDVSDALLAQVLPRILIGHLPIEPNHAAAMLNRPFLLFLASLLLQIPPRP